MSRVPPRRPARRIVAWLVLLASSCALLPSAASAAGTTAQVTAGLDQLVGQLGRPTLTSAQRARVHELTSELADRFAGDPIGGVPPTDVLEDLICVSVGVQQARDTRQASAVRGRLREAAACRTALAKLATTGGATGLAGDLAVVKTRLRAITSAATAGKVFGVKSTALRRLQSSIVAQRFAGATLHSVPFAQVYDDLECANVKAESGSVAGALTCAKRLRRRVLAVAPPQAPVTFGSDLTGTPVALPATFSPNDTEFWTAALTVPADGTITTFRLRTGDSPVDLPLRFSVVRPRPDGQVTVVTTTNPVYPLAAHDGGVHTYRTSALSFVCCKVQKGDLVTVDNSGTPTAGAYVWFAPSPGTTTLSHTSGGDSQSPGNVWAGLEHPGYETLLQVEMVPD